MSLGKLLIILSYILFFVSISVFAQTADPGIPSYCGQALVVLTPSFEATQGKLLCFERENSDKQWLKTGVEIRVIVGRKGLGWGIGINSDAGLKGPVKREGDKKSPAGIFELSSVFGYAPPEKMSGLNMPYIHVTELLECIDDIHSSHYTQIIQRKNVENVDWKSSEKMRSDGVWYELGVVVEHNTKNPQKGAGSCIFLHNWAGADDSTAGCTAMDPENMKTVAFWLDASKHPVLVQLTARDYKIKQKLWNLPEIPVKSMR